MIRLLQRTGLIASVPPAEMMLVNFGKMTTDPSKPLLIRCDEELGGFSTAQVELQQENNKQFGRFYGHLNLDLPPSRPDVVQSGYAMWRTRDMGPSWQDWFQPEFWNWERCSHMLLRVRGDRRKYYINIQAESPLATDIYQHRLFLKTPGEWETAVVPLSDFILTNWGVIQQQQELDLEHIRTIGIGLIDKQYGPFQLDIDWIKVISGDLLGPEIAKAKETQQQQQQDQVTPGEKLSIDE